ncbi:MAG TPA: CAP domain-containing protein [Jatrophihabitans sp.]|jgi:uncharacterized protein YkwD|uniref:CAP domain-containing protein n=1 Tax=Jatrophihabitans sp. TaxID=1932789 RepID=UPI002E0CE4AC|nr:CAP domain-containing protein [Jatrophihabitans sp.]
MPAKTRFPSVLIALTALFVPLLVAVAPPASANTAAENTLAAAVLSTMNGERKANGRAPLGVNYHLQLSARRHGLVMAKYNTMSHQLAGERNLGGREDYAGYPWTTCGENVAYTSTFTTAAVVSLQRAMYGERSPYDAHRQNILSWQFREVGVSAVVDTYHHRIWLTIDFGRR